MRQSADLSQKDPHIIRAGRIGAEVLWASIAAIIVVGLWIAFVSPDKGGPESRGAGPQSSESGDAAIQSGRGVAAFDAATEVARVPAHATGTSPTGNAGSPGADMPAGTVLRGVVRLPTGLPAQDERVEFLDQGRPSALEAPFQSMPLLGEVRTDVDGEFLWTGEPYRTVKMRLSPREQHLAIVTLSDLRSSETLHIDLQEAGAVFGRIDVPGVPAADLLLQVTEADRFGLGPDSVHSPQSDGGFLIERLVPGEHILQLRIPGAATLAERVFIEPGKYVEVEFGIESLHVIHGIVLDAKTRSPIVGAEIGMDGNFLNPARSGSTGEFELVLEMPDEELVGANARPIEAACRAAGYGTTAFRVPAPDAMVEVEMRNEVVVIGRVEDERGNGLSGATVAVISMPDFGEGSVLESADETDDSGSFRIRGVRPNDRVVVAAERPGYGTTYISLGHGAAPGVDLDAGVITLPVSGGIVGRNIDSTSRGLGGFILHARRVLDEQGADPAVQRAVQWRSASDRVRSSPGGEFVFNDLAPGRYLVTTSLIGRGVENTKSAEVEVLPGVPYSSVEFTFDLDAAISGRVTRASGGAAVGGAYIFVYKQDGPPGVIVGKGPVGPGGEFTISDVSPGRYRLVVRIPPHARMGDGAREAASAAFPGIVAPASGVELQLPDARELKGYVVDAEDRAVAGAIVAALQDRTVVDWCTTGADGSFVLQTNSVVDLLATRTIRKQGPEGETESADNAPGHRVLQPNVLPGTTDLLLRLPISLDH